MESTADDGLILGVVYRREARWSNDYFPQDLPDDWRFAYLANDVDCVMLPAETWSHELPALATSIAEAPPSLRFLLQASPEHPPPASALGLFADRPVELLVDASVRLSVDWPQWCAVGDGHWRDEQGHHIHLWHVGEVDLRDWRARAERLDAGVRGVLLDGVAASPVQVAQLRALLQLMGIA